MTKPLTVLCVGDVFGDPGRRAVHTLLPKLRKQYEVDLAVVNVENAAAGYGVTPEIARAFLSDGVDVMTSGNHTWDRKEIIEYIVKENLLLRPANYPLGTPGAGSVVVKAGPHKVGVLNVMDTPIIVVDAHCEATSESQALGWYLDGRVSAVVGTHRHVQTADERVLTQGTAYITDLGMTGPVDSVIGVDPELAIGRFLTQMPNRFVPAKGPVALHGVVIRIDPETGKALGIERLRVPAPA